MLMRRRETRQVQPRAGDASCDGELGAGEKREAAARCVFLRSCDGGGSEGEGEGEERCAKGRAAGLSSGATGRSGCALHGMMRAAPCYGASSRSLA